MDNKDPVYKLCSRYLENGLVYGENCKTRCEYFCIKPYKTERYVNCDTTSGNWVTASGEQPCMGQISETTTKKFFNFDSNVPASDLYQDNIDLDNFRTYKPPDFDMPSMDDMKIPTVKPFQFEDDMDHSNSNEANSGAVFGLIIAGIIGTMIIFIFMRVWIARCAASRRRQRMQYLVDQMNSQAHQSRQTRDLSRAVTSQINEAERTNNEPGNEDVGLVIVRIRRFLRIPLLRNPYNAFQNDPEPPPYDAESVPPPSYEETEGLSGSTTENNEQPAEVSCAENTDTPADPPPPYSASIV